MDTWGGFPFMDSVFVFVLLLSHNCTASVQMSDSMQKGFEGAEKDWSDNDGLFLISNSSSFAFGFQTTEDFLFLLAIVHVNSNTIVWTANRGSPVQNSDPFVFDDSGNARLISGKKLIWSPDTGGKAVSDIQLQDSGNLVMLGDDNSILWESFRYPTNTLLPNQEFSEGMSLSSNEGGANLSYFLQFQSGDVKLFVNFSTPQPYWSIGKDQRTVINREGGLITRAVIDGNSWKFYDQKKVLLLQFIFPGASLNSTWFAILESDGFIAFHSIGEPNAASPIRIPSDPCGTPGNCRAYHNCLIKNCECLSGLISRNCQTGIVSPCNGSKYSTEMLYAGDDLSYFALDYVSPTSTTDLNSCKASCAGNCSCLAMFFNNNTRNCYLFDNVGSFKPDNSSNYAAFVKVSTSHAPGYGNNNKLSPIVAIMSPITVLAILSMLYVGYRYHLKKKKIKMGNLESPYCSSEEDNFFDTLSGMPGRFGYMDLETATNHFSVKLGKGGFGSVYKGLLQDGTAVAVKKLEGVGQGKKEFKAEVKIIGSIHHLHLVRLKGFCTEGSHRLLAYEFMAKGSLDKWIFKRNTDGLLLDWDTRFNIAVGTAKGLAYLHDECAVKIVHCDIKPENVLLDDDFQAKVSDFGLAKLMTREQSHVFTTMRGTRGYLAPEWITNHAISEKSDVYSYGMVLFEIIGGRRNFDPQQSDGECYFPSFVSKKMEEGNVSEVLDSSLEYNPDDESVPRAIKVALWCIQQNMGLRPSMTKVVQMLQGLCAVPQPPTSSLMRSSLYANLFGQGSGTASDTSLSADMLSGPR